MIQGALAGASVAILIVILYPEIGFLGGLAIGAICTQIGMLIGGTHAG